MGAYGEYSSQSRNLGGFKLVTNPKETKEAKCNISEDAQAPGAITEHHLSLYRGFYTCGHSYEIYETSLRRVS